MVKPDTKSAPVRAAYRRGLSAGRRDLPKDTSNPYTGKEKLIDGETVHVLVGWSLLYHNTWNEGWEDGRNGVTGIR